MPIQNSEWCNRQRQYIPVTPGYKWEYLDIDGKWKEYNEFIQYEIEQPWDMGGEVSDKKIPNQKSLELSTDAYILLFFIKALSLSTRCSSL
jgi:hypothetical protein